MTRVVVGIFVGGTGKRMGGVSKGLLKVPSSQESLIERLVAVCAQGVPNAQVYSIGQATAYAAIGLPQLFDEPSGVGPIGGLRSLLVHARSVAATRALALACDLPFIDAEMIELLAAPSERAARVPFAAGRFQPLAAAYSPIPSLNAIDRSLALGRRALMDVLEQLGSDLERIDVDDARALVLRDWDTPEDITL